MSRVSFNQINALPDILDQVAFELLLGVVPLAGDTSDLTLKCQQASIPGFSNEAWEAMLHGHVRKFRGRKVFTRTLNVQFLESVDFSTYNKLKAWDEAIAGTNTGNSQGYQSDYSVTAALKIYDTTGRVANTIEFDNMFILEVSDIQLDGSSSTGVIVSAMFSFDRIIVGGTPLL